jgi:hypothetical protein
MMSMAERTTYMEAFEKRLMGLLREYFRDTSTPQHALALKHCHRTMDAIKRSDDANVLDSYLFFHLGRVINFCTFITKNAGRFPQNIHNFIIMGTPNDYSESLKEYLKEYKKYDFV